MSQHSVISGWPGGDPGGYAKSCFSFYSHPVALACSSSRAKFCLPPSFYRYYLEVFPNKGSASSLCIYFYPIIYSSIMDMGMHYNFSVFNS